MKTLVELSIALNAVTAFKDRFHAEQTKNKFDTVNTEFFVDGVNITRRIRWDETRTQLSAWRSQGTGKFYLRVDDSNGRQEKVFKNRKDGFNLPEMGAYLIAVAEREKADEARRRAIRENADNLSERIRKLKRTGFYVAAVDKPGHVQIRLDIYVPELTLEQAEKIHEVLGVLDLLKD